MGDENHSFIKLFFRSETVRDGWMEKDVKHRERERKRVDTESSIKRERETKKEIGRDEMKE